MQFVTCVNFEALKNAKMPVVATVCVSAVVTTMIASVAILLQAGALILGFQQ